MPAKASNGAAAVAPATSTAKRFELPALEFTFGSLTDGTDIPPPLPSPKEEAPSPPKSPRPQPIDVEKKPDVNGTANGHGTAPNKPELTAIPASIGMKRLAEDVPASPTLSSRGSLRRLLSKSLLNHAYDEQGSMLSPGTSRPPSRTASSIMDERKSKRSSGWFKRLRTNDHASKRTSQIFEEPKKPLGPPPPMIPELSALESKVDTHLGDDLFKEIK
ncbi:uncharacterized protein F4807DRAFT_348855 [Annulohypoxylon truncatum]|uniref:uncharacterized protein n=1 Tax=Annulohypoxylon truncatum TaxID=327061 RepID=UPI0020073733|nr:uncharacterized protein F4807DRAFT_348855 [Annulohypoxylon truncatum]KAI1212766.1 hypothetical protein F4807DRAFT_348855 [Annulohypoxylon truncatum]